MKKTDQNPDHIIQNKNLRNAVGEVTISSNKKRKVNNHEHRSANQMRKRTKKTFQMACKTGKYKGIKSSKV